MKSVQATVHYLFHGSVQQEERYLCVLVFENKREHLICICMVWFCFDSASFLFIMKLHLMPLVCTIFALVSLALLLGHIILLMSAKLYIYFYHKKIGGNCQPEFRRAS